MTRENEVISLKRRKMIEISPRSGEFRAAEELDSCLLIGWFDATGDRKSTSIKKSKNVVSLTETCDLLRR